MDKIKERIASLPQTDDKTDTHILKSRQKFPRSYMTWSNEEDEIVIELYQQNFLPSFIAIQLKRSQEAIHSRLKTLGLLNPAADKKTQNQFQTKVHEDTNTSSTRYKPETQQILQYWRNSLADADRMGLSDIKMLQGEQVELLALKNGKLQSSKIEKFFLEAENALQKSRNKDAKYKRKIDEEDITINKLQVIIAPYTAVIEHEHGDSVNGLNNPHTVFPLWLVANLTRTGELVPLEEFFLPWIERKCLTPNENNESSIGYPIIGDISHVDDFYTTHQNFFTDGKISWEKFFTYAEELFQTLLDKKHNIFAEQNYKLIDSGYILPTSEIWGVCKNIISTYDQHLSVKNENISPLLEEFCALTDRQYCTDQPAETIFHASQKHLGQMQNKFPLSESQRISLGYFNCDNNKDDFIFTVHGPPGTGKTNLLLSVIASKWIEAALCKSAPPIIVAASTNNLAVTNILDQFKYASYMDSPTQTIRWLPKFNSYGTYLAPTHKAQEAEEKGYLYRLREKNSGSIEKFYSSEYRSFAQNYFLEQFNQNYQKSETNLIYCKDFLHKQMLKKKSLLDNTISFALNLYNTHQNIIQQFNNVETLIQLISTNINKKAELSDQIKPLRELQVKWITYKSGELKWLRLFSWLSFVNNILLEKIKLFVLKHPDFFDASLSSINEIDEVLSKNIDEKLSLHEEISQYIDKLQSIKTNYEQLLSEKMALEQALGFELNIDHLFNYTDNANLLCKIDTTLRYELFILATHYWEAAWLLESATLNTLGYDEKNRRKYWQIQAMLTPCFVTTLHSGIGFFQYRNSAQLFVTLTDFIDLLIIDEAGQVMPAIAGAMLSTAKKALLVGDALQIEPIFSLTEGIDLANTKKFKLCNDHYDYERLKNLGILCAGDATTGHAYGNLIIVGQRKAKYHLQNYKLPGMLLKEHRRCAKEIISYCNELCYDNQLIPMADQTPCCFPRMGYAHIKGNEMRIGASRYNVDEAEAIATWIAKNKAKILATCGKDNLNDCIGIVTPFAAQGNAIRTKLRECEVNLDKVGTIHSLQGAEKPIIIFSPVYTAENKSGPFFFDRSPNMLNVAVSRAKMSFLVFGDIDIFDVHHGKLPSSLLAKYLFAQENNEIVDIIQPKIKNIVGDKEIRQINSLADHRFKLKESFTLAKNKLIIVSPFLRLNAIKSDNIPELIREYFTSISITIYTDPTLNKNHINEFNQAKNLLERSGATVYLVNNVHSKIIVIDESVIIEGSFNWLSAARINHEYQREESSIIYQGKYVGRFIKEAIEPIKNKVTLANVI